MQTVGALFWKLLERGGAKAIRLVVQIILARILSPDEFGALAILLVFVSLGDVLVLGGFSSALLQSDKVDESDYSTAFWLSMCFSIVVFAILSVLSPMISAFYNDEALTLPLVMLALQFFPLSFNSIQSAKTTRILDTKPIFIGVMVAEVLSGIVALLLAYLGLGLWSLVVQQVLSAVIACFITALLVKWRPVLVFNRKTAKELVVFGWKVVATELLNTASMSLYTMAIGKMYTTQQLGFYSQGQRYPIAISEVLTGALSPVLLARFSKGSHSSHLELVSVTEMALRILALLLFPISFFGVIFATPIVSVVLTDKWLPCVVFFQIFCLVSLLKSVSLILRQGMLATGSAQVPARIAVWKLLFSTALLFLAIHFGLDLTWVAAAWLASGALELILSVIGSWKTFSFSVGKQLSAFLPGITVSAAASLLALWSLWLFDSVPCAVVLFMVCSVVLVAGYLSLRR